MMMMMMMKEDFRFFYICLLVSVDFTVFKKKNSYYSTLYIN